MTLPPPGDVGTLALAYGLAGLAVAAYLLHLGRRVRALRQEVQDLQDRARREETSK